MYVCALPAQSPTDRMMGKTHKSMPFLDKMPPFLAARVSGSRQHRATLLTSHKVSASRLTRIRLHLRFVKDWLLLPNASSFLAARIHGCHPNPVEPVPETSHISLAVHAFPFPLFSRCYCTSVHNKRAQRSRSQIKAHREKKAPSWHSLRPSEFQERSPIPTAQIF